MNICIFGAASSKIDESYIKAVENLSEQLAQRGHSLVFGAGNNGLMGAAARGFHKGKGKVAGIVPYFFRTDYVEELYEECDEFIYTDTMAQRKAKMEDMADAFIIAPGGIGTFEEFFEVYVLRQLNRHNKALAIFDVNNYYRPMEALLEHAMKENFLNENCMKLYKRFDEDQVDALISYVEGRQERPDSVSEVKLG